MRLLKIINTAGHTYFVRPEDIKLITPNSETTTIGVAVGHMGIDFEIDGTVEETIANLRSALPDLELIDLVSSAAA